MHSNTCGCGHDIDHHRHWDNVMEMGVCWANLNASGFNSCPCKEWKPVSYQLSEGGAQP